MVNPNIQKAQEFFDSDKYLSEFYESALKSFNDKSNPLRLCNFACNIRNCYEKSFQEMHLMTMLLNVRGAIVII